MNFYNILKDEKEGKIALALSGGKDSTTLLHQLINYLKEENTKIKLYGAIIINHNMRKESKKESEEIKNYWKKKGVNVKIISKNKNSPLKNQKEARDFRINTLSTFALKRNIKTILIGHNLEDKIETYLIRKEKKSTFWGLSSMGDITYINNIKFARPLMHTSRKYIEEYIENNNLFYIEDSSNKSDKYRRNYIRHHIAKSINQREILNKINENISLRKNYFQEIKKWMSLYLIQTGYFSYKFFWNKLPKEETLQKLTLSQLILLIRGKPLQNWEKISIPWEGEKKNFHISNVSFSFFGEYCHVQNKNENKQTYEGKEIIIENRLFLYSSKSFLCTYIQWPFLFIENEKININQLKTKDLLLINNKKIKTIILNNNYESHYF